eukprot:4620091-Ditylum_brightwellii.AAC.2
MHHQRFDCAVKGQAKFISFWKNFKSLDPPKESKAKGSNTGASSMGKALNGCTPKRKRVNDEKTIV